MAEKIYSTDNRQYTEKSVSKRIEALFLNNLGKVVTREQILRVATDPITKKEPENWCQRLSELRRVMPTKTCWSQVLNRAGHRCEWSEDGRQRCGLAEGELDPVGGGTVKLTSV